MRNKIKKLIFQKKSKKSPLTQLVIDFKIELIYIGIFSSIVNLLMLVPTMYMLQVFDRVLLGYNQDTLLIISIIMSYMLVVMGFGEWFRSTLLIRTGVKIDEVLSKKT